MLKNTKEEKGPYLMLEGTKYIRRGYKVRMTKEGRELYGAYFPREEEPYRVSIIGIKHLPCVRVKGSDEYLPACVEWWELVSQIKLGGEK